jgi:adenosylmethionine-8-amino-7-oxononanoate aminotransferase
VADVRGVGLMLGIELDEDRDAAPVAAGARDDGVIVRATGQKIVMSPPLVVTRDQVDRVVDVLGRQLERL